MKDSAMGLPKNALPGAKFITYAQWKDMKEIPKTGLYLVNMTSVPCELPGRLKGEGYTLRQDGTLMDGPGGPVAVFTTTHYYQLQSDKRLEAIHVDRDRSPTALPPPRRLAIPTIFAASLSVAGTFITADSVAIMSRALTLTLMVLMSAAIVAAFLRTRESNPSKPAPRSAGAGTWIHVEAARAPARACVGTSDVGGRRMGARAAFAS